MAAALVDPAMVISTAPTSKYDILLKLVLVGESAVGKTSLVRRFVDETFCPTHMTTIGVDFAVCTFNLQGKVVKVQLWDTAGQERFRSIASSYFKGADGIYLVYDTSEPSTVKALREQWIPEAKMTARQSCLMALLGNKTDLLGAAGSPAPSLEDGRELAAQMGAKHYTASARTGRNVLSGFMGFLNDMVAAKLEQDARLEAVVGKKVPSGRRIRIGAAAGSQSSAWASCCNVL